MFYKPQRLQCISTFEQAGIEGMVLFGLYQRCLGPLVSKFSYRWGRLDNSLGWFCGGKVGNILYPACGQSLAA